MTELFKTPSMLRKLLFLPGCHFFKLLFRLARFCGGFQKQSKVSDGYVKFYNLLEDIFLIYSFLFFYISASKFDFTHTVSLQFFPKQGMSETFV